MSDPAALPSPKPPPRRPPLSRRLAPLPLRPGLALAATLAAGGMVVGVHFELWPWQWHQFLRDWVMHFCALVAAAIATAAVLGYFRAPTARQRRSLRRLGCGVPLAITLLHELGQSVWPHDGWTLLDTLRDALLNVVGAVVAWRLLAEREVSGPSE